MPPLPLHLSAVQYVGTLFNLAKAEQQLGRQEASQALMGQVLELADGVAGELKCGDAEGVASMPACLPTPLLVLPEVLQCSSMHRHPFSSRPSPPKPDPLWPGCTTWRRRLSSTLLRALHCKLFYLYFWVSLLKFAPVVLRALLQAVRTSRPGPHSRRPHPHSSRRWRRARGTFAANAPEVGTAAGTLTLITTDTTHRYARSC